MSIELALQKEIEESEKWLNVEKEILLRKEILLKELN
jgi:hypothetical protein